MLPHGVFGKTGRRPVDEALPADVLVVVVAALHVQQVEVRPAVAVEVGEAGVAAPRPGAQAQRLAHVLESPAPEVPVQRRVLGAAGVQVAREGIRQARGTRPPGPSRRSCSGRRCRRTGRCGRRCRSRRTAAPEEWAASPTPASCVMSRKRPRPSFSNSTLPPRTVVTNRSWSPSLSTSPNDAVTPMRSGKADARVARDVPERCRRPGSSRARCRPPG